LNRFGQIPKCIRKPPILANIAGGRLKAFRVTKQSFSVVGIQIKSDNGCGFLWWGWDCVPAGRRRNYL